MKNSLIVFGKAQISAFIGGLSDYAIMVALTEMLHFHYTLSIVISGAFGALVNFSINRYWAFQSNSTYSSSFEKQVWKFVFVVLGSILLKSTGTYWVTTVAHINYKISRIAVDLLISYSFNFPLMKYWVFKKRKQVIITDILFI